MAMAMGQAATWPAAIAIEVAAELHEYSGKLLNMIMATHTHAYTQTL